MKMIWWIAPFLMLISFELKAQKNQFILQGTILHAPSKVIYLRYVDYAGKELVDSAQIKNNAFSFTGKIQQPTRATLKTNLKFIADEENLNRATVYLEPKLLKVQVAYNQFKDIKVQGSKTQAEFNLLTAQQAPFVNQYITLRDSLAKKTQQKSTGVTTDEINNRIQRAVGNMRSVSYQFIKAHPDSWVSAFELGLLKNSWPVDSVRYLFNRLSPDLQKGQEGQSIAKKIELIDRAKSAIGAPAPAFSTTSVTGQPIKLSDFKGQYILLDFWGSWCAPCRAGHPHLLKLYEQYREKGIEFIGVACEDKPTAWRRAIEKDSVGIWKHLLDTELVDNTVIGEEQSLSKAYWIDSFPTKILIDPKGVIIGRYTGSDEQALDEKFKELFK